MLYRFTCTRAAVTTTATTEIEILAYSTKNNKTTAIEKRRHISGVTEAEYDKVSVSNTAEHETQKKGSFACWAPIPQQKHRTPCYRIMATHRLPVVVSYRTFPALKKAVEKNGPSHRFLSAVPKTLPGSLSPNFTTAVELRIQQVSAVAAAVAAAKTRTTKKTQQ